MKSRPFVHLHVHSEYSILDGLGRQIDFLNKAAEMNHPAIAFTEHGSMRGAYKLHENVNNMETETPPWPIYGCELYLCEDRKARGLPPELEKKLREENKGRKAIGDAIYQAEMKLGLRQRYHLTVIAKNQTGLMNLFKLTSVGWLEGFWKRPRVDLETLEKYHEGLIVLSGCMEGVVPYQLVQENQKLADERMDWFHELFGEDLYLEIQPTSMKEQVAVNKGMLRYAKRYGRPLVATVDAHYTERRNVRTHEVLLCIRTHSKLSDPNRFRFSVKEFWLKSWEEMKEAFTNSHPYIPADRVNRALLTTLEVAEKAQARIEVDRFKALVPAVDIPKKFDGDEFSYLAHLCWVGWESRDMVTRIRDIAKRKGISTTEMSEQYVARLKHEMKAIKRQNVVRYFLVVWDLYRWAKNEAMIECGPGRGSAGGCLVSFLLRITDTDPIEHGLLFERFLNPDRIDLPDVDMDFEDERREEVIQYLIKRYGRDKTAQITTITTLKGRQAIRDISRVLEIPFSEVDEVTSSIIDRSSGDERASQTIEDSFTDFEVCREFNKRHPEVLRHAKVLEGHARGMGKHAAGVVVSPIPLTDVVPMETREQHGVLEPMTGFEMYGVQGMGLLKMDVLGLRNLTVIKHCLRAVKERHEVEVNWDGINLHDKRVLDNFTAHAYAGVFQFDTPSADKLSEGVDFTSFEDVVAMIALDRPGTARSGLGAEYLRRKRDPSKIKSIHPVVDEICSDTYGVIVYQEHVIRMFTDFAGFAPGTADSLRKKIAKKWGDEALGKERQNFIDGAVAKGYDAGLAAKLMDQITFFGSYGFNKSHSTAYALIGYREMWLKTYYPVEFMWALLYCEPDENAVRRFVKECHRLGIKVKLPNVNRSKSKFSLDGDAIIGSLSGVKGCGEIASNAIEVSQPFKSFSDFLSRVDRRKVHKGVVLTLARAGALDRFLPNRRYFVENIEEIWKGLGKSGWEEKVEEVLKASKKEPGYTEQEAKWASAEVCPLSSGKHPLVAYDELLHEKMNVDWVSMDNPELYDRSHAFLHGILVEIKWNQIGDFHTGKLPDEDERQRMKWGARYANVNVEDISGKNNRCKIDVDTFDEHRPIIDRGIGTPVAFHASLDSRWRSIRVHFMVDLDLLRRKLDAGKGLSVFERVFLKGKHPVKPHSKVDIEKQVSSDGEHDVVGIVTHMNVRLDKKMGEMCFMGLLGFRGYLDVICFASSWESFKDKFGVGDVIQVRVSKRGNTITLEQRSEDRLSVLEQRPRLA